MNLISSTEDRIPAEMLPPEWRFASNERLQPQVHAIPHTGQECIRAPTVGHSAHPTPYSQQAGHLRRTRRHTHQLARRAGARRGWGTPCTWGSCRRGDLNPHARNRALGPQPSASANSATPTWTGHYTPRRSTSRSVPVCRVPGVWEGSNVVEALEGSRP